MAAPKYEIVYFNGRGRAEVARQILAAAGVEFTDTRLEGDKWQALKPDTPFGQLPLMKVGSDVIAQSMSMARYCAREHGLAGDGSMNQAKVDMIMEQMSDMFMNIMKAMFEKDEAKKAELTKKVKEETYPSGLAQLEKLAGDGYFVGGKLSAADIKFHVFCDKNPIPVELSSPKLKKIFANVQANPGIKAWLEKRPDSKF